MRDLLSNPAVTWIKRHFLTIDARTLAVFRIAFAAVLLVDIVRRSIDVDVWYSETGLLPTAVARLHAPLGYSFLWGLDTPAVSWVFAACAFVYLALLVGFATRIAQILVIPCLLSLQHRIQLVASGGDIVLVTLACWTVFLPLGRRFSADATIRRRRGRARPPDEVVSLAVAGLLVQLSVIYLFNSIQKSGATWTSGAAIHYTLWQERIVTPAGVWLREIMTPSLSTLLTRATTIGEGVLPLLILSPVGKPWTRRAAILTVLGVHAGIAATINVGPFSSAMIVFSTLLLTDRDWVDLTRSTARFRISTGDDDDERSEAARRPAWTIHVGRGYVALREIAVVWLAYVLTVQVLLTNWIVPKSWHPTPPDWHSPLVTYMRWGQHWGMFSPDIATTERGLVVDAELADGTRVDPLNETATDIADPATRQLPERLGYDIFWSQYVNQIAQRKELHQALHDWIVAYPARSGHPGNRVTVFWVLSLERASPRPNEARVPLTSTTLLLEGPRTSR